MEGLPLHPAVVHLPIGLTFIMPIVILMVMVGIKRCAFPKKVWALVLALQVILSASGFVSMKLGDNEEDKVENVVSKEYIHEHEEKGEAFVYTSIVAIVLCAVILKTDNQKLSVLLPSLLFLVSLLLVGLAYQAGHSGGELVYKKGAAKAYSN